MTDHDRGAYTPQTDAPLAFDARAPRGGRKPLPLALIGGGVLALVLVAAIGMYYSSGVGPAPGEPPTVGQPVETVKSPPPAMAAPGENVAEPGVFAQAPAGAAPAFAPAPEQPQPRPEPRLSVQTVDPSPLKPAQAAPPAPAMSAPLKPSVPAPPPAKPVAVATVPVKPAPSAAKPPAAKPPVAKPPAAPVAVAAAPTAAGAAAAMVQIGAYSSTALADKGWTQASTEFPGFMVGKSKRVEPIARDGKTLYRTSVSGFATKASAQAFCDAWKAKGRPCFVKG